MSSSGEPKTSGSSTSNIEMEDDLNLLPREGNVTEPAVVGAQGGTDAAGTTHPEPDVDPSTSSPTSPATPDPFPTGSLPTDISLDPGARPRRHMQPPERYGYPPSHVPSTRSLGTRSSRRKGTRNTRSALSQATSHHTSKLSRRSSSSHTSKLSEIQHCILDEKTKRDELEELRRQRREDEELDEKCSLIDKKAKEAQRVQEEAHNERERLIRQTDMDRHIRI